MSYVRIAIAWGLLAGGCVGEEPIEVENVNKPSVGGDTGCGDWGCGSNSPEIDLLGFHDLNVVGLQNLQGFHITGFHHFGVPYRPYVRNAQLYARHANGTVIAGSQLSGAIFNIRNAFTGLQYELRVGDTSLLPFWAKPAVSTWTYVLEWKQLGVGQFRNVCKNPGSALKEDSLSGFKAVLFEDDRINADELAEKGLEKNWFNIGCGGHALAKQHLMAHTQAAQALTGLITTIPQRTANLKMLSADYCGTGDVFTVAGQPLRYRDENNWVNTTVPNITPLEARFTENGATCLETPRIAYGVPSPLALSQFGGNVEGWIALTCHRPPACKDTNIDVMAGAHVLSANPP